MRSLNAYILSRSNEGVFRPCGMRIAGTIFDDLYVGGFATYGFANHAFQAPNTNCECDIHSEYVICNHRCYKWLYEINADRLYIAGRCNIFIDATGVLLYVVVPQLKIDYVCG